MNEEKKPWFGPKRIGFGIGPKSWQGWLTIAVYITVVVLSTRRSVNLSHPAVPIAVTVIATIALIVIMVLKGSPRHRN